MGSATVTASSDTLTVVGHSLIDGDIVMVDTLTGGADGPLIEGAVYFVRNVAGDDFQLSGTRGSQLKTFATDGTAEVYAAVPQYDAQALRRNDSALMFHGSADGLGARQGVRPGGDDVVTVAGTDWTVNDHAGVVYPGLSSASGPYRYHQTATSDTLDPADGSSDRVDGLDLLVEDDDEDASGFRRSRVVYVAGTPGAGEPAGTPNALRLGTILVPAGGTPSPSVQSLGQATVASGGVLPVQSDGERPSSGRYEGMLVYHQGDDELQAWDGSGWSPTQRGWTPIATANIANQSFVDVDLTGGGRYAAGTFHVIRLWLRGQLDDTADIWARINNSGSADHRWGHIVDQFSTGTVADNGRGEDDEWRVGRWQTGPCVLELTLFGTSALNTVNYQAQATAAGGSAGHLVTISGGRITSAQLVDSIRFGRLSPSTEFSELSIIAEGYRP